MIPRADREVDHVRESAIKSKINPKVNVVRFPDTVMGDELPILKGILNGVVNYHNARRCPFDDDNDSDIRPRLR